MSSTPPCLPYRADIDGLRAVAVLSVVVFHAFPRYAPGGFVGVDIFFVISGYLISLISFRGLQAGHFSFANFYARRIKRIFPALLLVVSTCYVLGWFALLPDEFKQLGKHIAAGMGFVQNVVLWQEAGYFDIATELKPLMHLWSLAIEEQFYLFYPLLLWLLWAARVNVLTCLLLLASASLFLSLRGLEHAPIHTFFAPHTRVWELLVGAILAYVHAFGSWRASYTRVLHAAVFNAVWFREVPATEHQARWLANGLACLGLGLIALALVCFSPALAYPGLYALVPVLGATLIILAGQQAWLNQRVLSHPALVWIGLISYPLYLWHWPLLSFARIVESDLPSRGIRISAVILSVMLAALTYYCVEKYIRNGRRSRLKVSVLCALALIVGYAGYNAYARDGLSFRPAAEVTQLNQFDHPYRQSCTALTDVDFHDDWCNLDPTQPQPANVVLLGDSISGAFSEMLREFSKTQQNFSAIQIGRGQCPMLLGYGPEYCRQITEAAVRYIAEQPHIDTLVFGSNWTLYYQDKNYHWLNHYETQENFWRSLERTLAHYQAHGKRIVFLLATPQGLNPRSCIVRPLRLSDHNLCHLSLADATHNDGEYRAQLIPFLDARGLRYFDPFPALCPDGECKVIDHQHLIWSDNVHMSEYGARYLARRGKEALQTLFATRPAPAPAPAPAPKTTNAQ